MALGKRLARALGHRYRWVIWLTLSLAAFSQNLQLFAYSVLIPSVLSELRLSYALAGTLSSAYMLSVALSMTPSGILSDRIGVRKMMIVALALLSAGALLFATATTFELAFLSRVLMGAGAAAVMILPAPILAFWFPKAEYRSMFGLHVSVGKVGSVLATWALPPLVLALGWRLGYGILSLLGPLSLLAALVFVVGRPEDVGLPRGRSWASGRGTGGRIESRSDARLSWWRLLRLPGLLALGVSQFFYFGAYFGMVNWLPTYFRSTVGLAEVEAGLFTGVILWGTIVGFAASGPAANAIGRCRPLYSAGLATTGVFTILFAASLVPGLPTWAWIPLLFAFGLGLSAMVLIAPLVTSIVPVNSLATGSGLAFALGFTGAMVTPPVIGALADYTGSLSGAFWLAVGCAFLGFGTSLLVREGTGPAGLADD